MRSIKGNMIMLENQIPLFLLDRLLALQLSDSVAGDTTGFVSKLALRFFNLLMPTGEPLMQSDRTRLESAAPFDTLAEQGGLHCLDVLSFFHFCVVFTLLSSVVVYNLLSFLSC